MDKILDLEEKQLKASDFEDDFVFGVSTAAAQIEGAWNEDGKGPSIWDAFAMKNGKIKNNDNPFVACNHYHRFKEDISLINFLSIPNYRFSISWPRIFPEGKGHFNQKGLDFYDRLIDESLSNNITPWITLYHWDLPQMLEEKGGWQNRDILGWFTDYITLCVKKYSDRVKHFMVLNEPMVVAGAGYFLGIHAPGKRGVTKFLKATHHLALAQAEGARAIKQFGNDIKAGTTFSCSLVESVDDNDKNIKTALRVDALLNRLFIEPLAGAGYPLHDLPFMESIEKYFLPGDEQRLAHNMDFIGIQNYTREIVKYSWITPYLHASLVPAPKRNVGYSAMGWEIYPPSIYAMLKKFSAYSCFNHIYVTESGIALHDQPENGVVQDMTRIAYLNNHLNYVLKAKQEGVPVKGFFVWTLLDNFEWAEGYHPRFGLVYVDFSSLERTVKKSGLWYRQFLQS
jgi:beta-glucosidase